MKVEILAERDYDRADLFFAEQLDKSRTALQKLLRMKKIITETGYIPVECDSFYNQKR